MKSPILTWGMCGTHEPLAQVHNRTKEDGESRQQTHYFHCDQIGIPREMTDKDVNELNAKGVKFSPDDLIATGSNGFIVGANPAGRVIR